VHKGVSMNRPSRNNTAKNCSAVTGIYAFFAEKCESLGLLRKR
jgi:hypothetical protein